VLKFPYKDKRGFYANYSLLLFLKITAFYVASQAVFSSMLKQGEVKMMSVISVTPDQLREQSRVYIQARDEVQAAKERVDAMNNQIAEQWKGQAFQAYLQQFDQLAGHVRQFNELLVSINEQLNKYATTIEERDRQDAGAFGLN